MRAMELRLTALGDELVAAFNQAAGSSSLEQILNLEKFCKHFGAADLRYLRLKPWNTQGDAYFRVFIYLEIFFVYEDSCHDVGL